MAIPLIEGFGHSLINFIIYVPIGALLLWLSGKIFKEKFDYVKSLIPSAITGAFNSIIIVILILNFSYVMQSVISYLDFFISLGLFLTLPTLILKIKWKKGLLVGLVWYLFFIAINYVVSPLVGKIQSFIF